MQLTLLLFERMGLLLILAFMIIRIPVFRTLPDRRTDAAGLALYAIFFGLFSIAGTYAGVTVDEGTFATTFLTAPLEPGQALADSASIGIIAAGLLGGVRAGTFAGLLSGLHAWWIGGMTGVPDAVSAPIIGLLSGWIGRFFDEERVIAPMKALFIGVFLPIVSMGAILVAHRSSDAAIRLVDAIGIPTMLANSVGLGIFVAMVLGALREQERAAALETERALYIAESVLPYLKRGLTYETAEATAELLYRELRANSVAVTDTERILAFVGVGKERFVVGEPIQSELSREALLTGRVLVAADKRQIQPHHPSITAQIVIPFSSGGKTAGLIKLYFQSVRQISAVEEALARGLSKLIGIQLDLAMAEQLRELMKDAELKALQAQINPHFLFNTLNAIVTLIRVDPNAARQITVKLGAYLRMNLTMTQSPLVPLAQELEHLRTYISLMRIRFEDRLAIEVSCERGLETASIPPSTLQPLVENSVQHGFRGRTSPGEVRIEIARAAGGIAVEVRDNGVGFEPGRLGEPGDRPAAGGGSTGIGLYNVNRRLIHLFGPASGLRLANAPEGGAVIRFTIPFDASREREGDGS